MTALSVSDSCMSALLFDTETTGTAQPQVIEAAWLRLSDPVFLLVNEEFEQRYRPDQANTLGALATHHIYDEELQDCPRTPNSSCLPTPNTSSATMWTMTGGSRFPQYQAYLYLGLIAPLDSRPG